MSAATAFLDDPFTRSVAEAFCQVGRRVWEKGYVASNDGNFSYRLAADRILTTPTMISKGFMRPEDMVLVDLEGNQVGGARRLTSEVRIHLLIYRERPDVYSVVHAHPPHATAFAIARQPLPQCILAEAEVNLGLVPIAPYATTGTWEFARTILPWVAGHDAFLLQNHGALVVGRDPFDAYYKLETLDQYARILILTRQIGEWNQLAPESVRELLGLKRRLRIADPRHAAGGGCDGAVPPSPLPALPTGPFVPDRTPITDAPKFSTLPFAEDAPPPSAAQRGPARDEIERAVREILRSIAN